MMYMVFLRSSDEPYILTFSEEGDLIAWLGEEGNNFDFQKITGECPFSFSNFPERTAYILKVESIMPVSKKVVTKWGLK